MASPVTLALRIAVAALLAGSLAAGLRAGAGEAADAADDPHLVVVPRTAAEVARIVAATRPTADFTKAEPFEDRPAGAATAPLRDAAAAEVFSQPSANIGFAREMEFKLGNALFRKLWVSAPASTLASDGLGPLYNARACQSCHLKDGRGHPPAVPGEPAVSMFLRVSVPDRAAAANGIADYLSTLPDPVYGSQLQDVGTAGQRAEYRLGISYAEVPVTLAGGETASLRRPVYSAEDLGYGPLHPDAMLSPRVAPQMIGLGLLEAIPAADILAAADDADRDGDGISGRANIVMSAEFGVPMLGRFGAKAGTATIREQSAAAFAGDMGLSSTIHPAGFGDCTAAQPACRAAPDGNGDAVEVPDEALDLVTFYARNLAVPARRDAADAQVLRGKSVFYAAGCTGCHTPKFVTARLSDRPEQSFQLIWPYTDLLLHDMGEGLADHRPEARATGREWRTAPLWGIGLTRAVTGRETYLHDGRARTVLEAVLWHGGEAQAGRDRIVALPVADRAALIRYLESL